MRTYGRGPRSALCRVRGGLRAEVRVSIRDRPDHPTVSLLMIREPVHAARNESAPAQTIHRPLHRRRITKGVFAFRASRYASHGENGGMRVQGSESARLTSTLDINNSQDIASGLLTYKYLVSISCGLKTKACPYTLALFFTLRASPAHTIGVNVISAPI
jgi:hypothetical protein